MNQDILLSLLSVLILFGFFYGGAAFVKSLHVKWKTRSTRTRNAVIHAGESAVRDVPPAAPPNETPLEHAQRRVKEAADVSAQKLIDCAKADEELAARKVELTELIGAAELIGTTDLQAMDLKRKLVEASTTVDEMHTVMLEVPTKVTTIEPAEPLDHRHRSSVEQNTVPTVQLSVTDTSTGENIAAKPEDVRIEVKPAAPLRRNVSIDINPKKK